MAKKNIPEQTHGELHLHEHNAPTYNINIGYVDKQINGDYYEYNYGEGKKIEGEKQKVKKAQRNIQVFNKRAAAGSGEAKTSYPFVTNQSIAESVVAKILTYLQGKKPSQAKDVMKPIRAAQDAGMIRRITFEEMQNAFPDYCPKNKSSVSKYTKEDETPYIDEAFKNMVEEFKALKQQ